MELQKKAKKAALGDYLSQQGAHCVLLRGYKDAILRTDERSHVLQTKHYEGVQRLHRILLCLGVCRQSFLHCRFLLAMNGAFTKEIISLTILMAVSVYEVDHAVLLAWAIVESESEQSWHLFLSNLLLAIPAATLVLKLSSVAETRSFCCG